MSDHAKPHEGPVESADLLAYAIALIMAPLGLSIFLSLRRIAGEIRDLNAARPLPKES